MRVSSALAMMKRRHRPRRNREQHFSDQFGWHGFR
jgi:hypothetical protein